MNLDRKNSMKKSTIRNKMINSQMMKLMQGMESLFSMLMSPVGQERPTNEPLRSEKTSAFDRVLLSF
jgi:hypothetical protein